MRIALDWSHKEQKLAVFDGKKMRASIPKLNEGDRVYTENFPIKYAQPLLNKGVEIYRCRPNDTAQFRQVRGWGKTDQLDAILIWQLAEATPEVFRRWMGDPLLTTMYKQYKEITREVARQKERVWAKNEDIAKAVVTDLEKIKRKIARAMKKELDKYSIWPWLEQVDGIGIASAAGLVAYIDKLGIENIPTVSALWHYFGAYPVEGKAVKRTKGSTISYNPHAKTLALGEIGPNFVRSGGFYRNVYDKEKAKQLGRVFKPGELASKYNGYKKTDLHLSKGHADNRAKRKAVKLFLSHLYVIWRQLKGLNTRPPYINEQLKHETYIEPPFIPAELVPFKPF